ncbi:hypothetical protein OAS86_04820 [Gammaproteobacteria bacterium]|nr:hypothetical protein [Gammaproteobacteria bacterium]
MRCARSHGSVNRLLDNLRVKKTHPIARFAWLAIGCHCPLCRLRLDSPGYCECCSKRLLSQPDRCITCMSRLFVGRCLFCPTLAEIDTLIVAAPFERPLSRSIEAFKYHRQFADLKAMSKLVVQRLETRHAARAPLLPIPMHWRRCLRRGYQPNACFARAVADIAEWPLELDLLKRRKLTDRQASLSRRRRLSAQRGSFKVDNVRLQAMVEANDNQPLTLWLIDDIVTTGATLRAAAAALRRSPWVASVNACALLRADQ